MQTYPRLKKIAEKIVSVQRLELRPRRSKGIYKIVAYFRGYGWLQINLAKEIHCDVITAGMRGTHPVSIRDMHETTIKILAEVDSPV